MTRDVPTRIRRLRDDDAGTPDMIDPTTGNVLPTNLIRPNFPGRGGISKRDMVLNGATPRMEVNPETYEVLADGELLICEPAKVLPMAQRYFLF